MSTPTAPSDTATTHPDKPPGKAHRLPFWVNQRLGLLLLPLLHVALFGTLRPAYLDDLCVGPVCGTPAVPHIAQFTLLALTGLGFLYGCTRLGRELLLTGANPAAAELSGVPTGRRTVLAHALSGLLAALAGFMAAIGTGTFRAPNGDSYMLPDHDHGFEQMSPKIIRRIHNRPAPALSARADA
ncbi:ABC transporter permease subunit [Streptomyces sp. BE303]|uniref:ABC transporter permease subunit n=1 Tax=Streptomyces sp. BE303 TaxID=3002528 RepID=UPI002E776DAA|nr:hypothetical protein [Streptomyces sp. BE303]MED7947362.1 hypothetical protein [Streptomyces sp. BE303]